MTFVHDKIHHFWITLFYYLLHTVRVIAIISFHIHTFIYYSIVPSPKLSTGI